MHELKPITVQQPGVIRFENYEEVKACLIAELEKYQNIVYSEDGIKKAKEDKTRLKKIKTTIEDTRKEIKKIYMEPFSSFDEKLKELESLIKEPLDAIDLFVKDGENKAKLEKKKMIKSYFDSQAGSLGELADRFFESEKFFDSKWLNASKKATEWQSEIKEKIGNVSKDVYTIQQTGGRYTTALITKYMETQSLEETITYRDKLIENDGSSDVYVVDDEDNVIGYKVLKINATTGQMCQLFDYLEVLGIDYEELEDGMPKDAIELTKPDFDSFVAFDIETTGSLGAEYGDAPAEITEIGAVKVINGEIVSRFDMLCNPGREIVSKIAELTHITDEMVAYEPPVSEVIKAFAEYIGDLPLVGHNIKSSDLKYISKAAKKAGVLIENPFFDTCRFAQKFKVKNNWEKVKLEYLSEYYGIEQTSAHRAYCDAEANVGVYFKLKEEMQAE